MSTQRNLLSRKRNVERRHVLVLRSARRSSLRELSVERRLLRMRAVRQGGSRGTPDRGRAAGRERSAREVRDFDHGGRVDRAVFVVFRRVQVLLQ